MERTVGTRAAHAALNQRMASVMGTSAAERMHQLMGRRYAVAASRPQAPAA